MDFSKLSEKDLDEFIGRFRTRAYQKYLPISSNRNASASQLFEISKQIPNFVYPLPIIDLYLASQYTGPLDKQYPIAQIQNLTEADINYLDQFFHFGASQNSLKVNRERVIRIFRYLGILDETGLTESSLQMLLTGPVWEIVRSHLSIDEVESLLVNSNVAKCGLPVKVTDPNGFISEIPCQDHRTFRIIPLIEQIGSGAVLIRAIYLRQHQLIRKLLSWGVPPDFYYGFLDNLISTSSFGSTPLLDTIKNGDLIGTQILLLAGANVNGFQLDQDFIKSTVNGSQLPTPLHQALKFFPSQTNISGKEILVNPTIELLNKHRIRDISYLDQYQQAIIRKHQQDALNGSLIGTLVRKYPDYNLGEINTMIEKIRILQSPAYQVPKIFPISIRNYEQESIQNREKASTEILRLLLTTGANPNESSCPLMFVSKLDQAKILIEFGADPNLICEKAFHSGKVNTPLAAAVVWKHFNIARYLLNQGADPSISTINGKSLLEFTKENKMTNFTKLLTN